MKKLTWILAAGALAIGCTATGSIISANAGVKESDIGTQVLTDAGRLNILDWDAVGESEHFVPTITNYYAGSPAADTTYVYYGEGLDLSEGDVVFEYDLLSGSPSCWMGPVASKSQAFKGAENAAPFQNYGGSYSVPETTTDWSVYTDEALTTDYTSLYGGSINLTYREDRYASVKVRFTFKKENRVLGVQSFGILADNSEVVTGAMWFKDFISADACTGDSYFGTFFGATSSIDNVVVKQGNKVLAEVGFDDATELVSKEDVLNEAVNTSGKLLLEGPRFGESFVKLSNLSASDRLVSGLSADGTDCEKAFVMEGQLRINSLVEKFGLATGLEKSDSAVDSYLYFYNEGETTKVASTKTGEAVDLGANLVGKTEFTPFKIEGTSDGKVTLSILDKTAEFTGFTVKGKIAFVVSQDGANDIDLEKTLTVKTYSYRGSENEGNANNFNTGYLNPNDWATQSTTSNFLEDSKEAKGIFTEDGILKYWGCADGTYFSSTAQYADYILEFDHISYAKNNVPATTWTYGHGGVAICLGSNSYAGWVNGVMIIIQSEYFQLQDFKTGVSTQTAAGTTYADGTFVHASAEQDKITSIKVVVINGNIKIYMQDITTAAFDSANYVLAAEFNVPDTYGYISFAANESSFLGLDNVRITSISDPSQAVMEEKAAAYVDRQPIADEAEPVALTAPVLTISDKVVSWTAVANATGYKVLVNGVNVGTQMETTYTIANTQAGKSYDVQVVALGDGAAYIDSAESNKVTYKEPAAESSASAEASDSAEASASANSEEEGGCFGTITLASLLPIGLALVGATALRNRRKED